MAAAPSIKRVLNAKLRVGVGGFLAAYNHWISPSQLSPSFCSSAVAGSSVSDSASPTVAPTQAREEQKRWSKWLLFIPGAITFGLGTWQIFRRQDKVRMLEYRQMRLNMEPLKLNDVAPSSETMDSLEFRRVACTGVFDEERSVFVGPRSRSISGVTENGYYIVTLLVPIANNSRSIKCPMLVNRGWVPRSWRDEFLETNHEDSPKVLSPSSQKSVPTRHWWAFWSKIPEPIKDLDGVSSVTPVEVTGVVRGSEKPSIFVPENDPSSSQWFYVDVPAIARACGLPQDTLYVEDMNENVNPSNPYPIPKDVNTLIRSSVMPQDHLNYILTWYSLSAAVTFMAFKRLRPKRRRR
ncbi:hypothetical protein SAY87_023463 [Trapa incisa]|uniref:SURF1-like protein n=1 Tax=Trapa incisa TaxID=236973 RepID=A0AAN7QR48_9MYRT|nr:hypothetical protein SAY87_023463 [Trapa incisa]